MAIDNFPVPAETAKAPAGTAARLIQVAKSQVGYIEGPKDNETKYGAYTKANFQPWCGSFVNWCANEAGVKIPNTVYTPGGAEAFKKKGAWIDGDIADPEPGDIAYFDFPSDGVDRISHVGIVIEDNEDGTVWCIEGNTSGTKKGSQRNGGEACKKLRAYKKNKAGEMISIVGFGRPKFKSVVAAKPAATATGVCPTCGK
jgi:cell wall-associated NlpC family hydrolase